MQITFKVETKYLRLQINERKNKDNFKDFMPVAKGIRLRKKKKEIH